LENAAEVAKLCFNNKKCIPFTTYSVYTEILNKNVIQLFKNGYKYKNTSPIVLSAQTEIVWSTGQVDVLNFFLPSNGMVTVPILLLPQFT